MSISKLIHIQSLKIDASLLIVTSQSSEGKNKQGANKLFIRHLVFKDTDNLGESYTRYRIDMQYNKCEPQIKEKHQAKW